MSESFKNLIGFCFIKLLFEHSYELFTGVQHFKEQLIYLYKGRDIFKGGHVQQKGVIKVAKHSFCALLMQFSAHIRIAKNKHAVNGSIILFTLLSVLFFSPIERSVLMGLVFYYKDMLEKATVQRIQQLSAFLCYLKNPVKCSTCTVTRKIETDCFCRNLLISNYPVVRISRKFAKKIEKPCELTITKNLNFDITEHAVNTIYSELQKLSTF